MALLTELLHTILTRHGVYSYGHMTNVEPDSSQNDQDTKRFTHWPLWLGTLCLLLLIFALLPKQKKTNSVAEFARTSQRSSTSAALSTAETRSAHRSRTSAGPSLSPEQIVAAKVIQFAQNRRALLYAMAKHYKLTVSPEIEAFFNAVEKGQWDELNERFKALMKLKRSDNPPPELANLWGPILETLGVAESAHDWPAQRLLDYGNSILDSLRPGMVYVGGTDPGRFIPTLLNETTDGERHIVLTQNGLADGSYLEYLRYLYGDQMATLTSEESQKAFQNYLEDAQKRLTHDQQFPDEPKQIRPGEDIRIENGRVQVSGQIAVMAINELLLQMIMDKNPDSTFALEESFPLHSTYTNASPLGPIMELRVRDDQNALNADTARQTLDYWQAASQQILSGTTADTPEGLNVLKTYSKMAATQGNLFAERNLNAEAEQAYKLGMQIYPDNPEATYGLAKLWGQEGRVEEAKQLVQAFQKAHPQQAKDPVWTATFRYP